LRSSIFAKFSPRQTLAEVSIFYKSRVEGNTP
jgi:hypothetical protein